MKVESRALGPKENEETGEWGTASFPRIIKSI
jgi:hypothetical protein